MLGFGVNEYTQVTYPATHDTVGTTTHGMPFKVGDRAIDDRGQIGVIAAIGSWMRRTDGSFESYSVHIRYGWDSELYGLERVAWNGEFSLVDDNGEITQDC